MSRVAVVTGSSRGIGRAVLERLAEEHDCVVHHRRSPADAERAAEVVRALGHRATIVQADLHDPDGVATLVDGIASAYGRVDSLVVNAASTVFRPLLSLERHHAERTMTSVVVGFVDLITRIAPMMPDGAHVVAVSGLDARFAQAGHALLGAAKASLESLIRTLAVELGPRGITANCVVPGAIDTDSLEFYLRDDADARDRIVNATPLRRLGQPDDIASMVAFLCSSQAAFVTGQALVVDGGISTEGGPWASMRDLWN